MRQRQHLSWGTEALGHSGAAAAPGDSSNLHFPKDFPRALIMNKNWVSNQHPSFRPCSSFTEPAEDEQMREEELSRAPLLTLPWFPWVRVNPSLLKRISSLNCCAFQAAEVTGALPGKGTTQPHQTLWEKLLKCEQTHQMWSKEERWEIRSKERKAEEERSHIA